MLAVFMPDTKITFIYNFVAPLREVYYAAEIIESIVLTTKLKKSKSEKFQRCEKVR